MLVAFQMFQRYVFCSGYQGQMILIIPSLDLVVVRMGLKESPEFNFNEIIDNQAHKAHECV
jgi:CubicO group peptidase (beta-lactamase class C family)